MTLDEAAAREMADIEYLDDARDEIVYVNEDSGEVVHRKNVVIGVDEDSIQPSDRCPRCSAIVACQRCLSLVETAREDDVDAVELREEVFA